MLVTSIQHDSQVSQHVAPSAKSFYDSLWSSVILSKAKITILAALHINIPVRDPNLEWLSWLNYCISSLSKSNAALLFITFWAIWSFRNRLVHENVLPALDSYVLFIRNYAAEYTTSQLVLNHPSHPSPSHWNPPSGNLIKVNFDAAFDTNSFSSSSDIVFRNNEGLLMAVAVFPHSHVPYLCVAEAQACLDVVSLDHELSFHNIIIEGDSLTVIKKSTLHPLIDHS
ncbi:hypothetical protein V6N13_088985 [Hibiscus sabdariffa]